MNNRALSFRDAGHKAVVGSIDCECVDVARPVRKTSPTPRFGLIGSNVIQS